MTKLFILCLSVFLFVSVSAFAQEDEAAALKQAAENAIAEGGSNTQKPEETVFESGGLGLQAINPEISITGDMIEKYQKTSDSEKISDFNFRTLGLHFQSYLDPYSRFKSAVEISPGGAELGEAYFTRFGVLKNLNITAGKFRQQFGVVNRWHKHGLDQIDFPLALRKIFGEDGLNQSGMSFDWFMPNLAGASQELNFQITNGENTRLFAQNTKSMPCFLAHYKNYRDLSQDTYLEMGLTALAGWNNEWAMLTGSMMREKESVMAGSFDITLLWEPSNRMRYRNFLWRTEFYFLKKKLLAPDASGRDSIKPWGAYSYVQEKISRTLIVGFRGDYYKPDFKNYANLNAALSLSPLAVDKTGARQWQIGPYITWYQSPFVHFRLEYNHLDSKNMGGTENTVMLQCIFAGGPHKHDKY